MASSCPQLTWRCADVPDDSRTISVLCDLSLVEDVGTSTHGNRNLPVQRGKAEASAVDFHRDVLEDISPLQ